MLDKNKPILVAGAWPYANASLHLGHIAGLIGGDVLARYFRQVGHPVAFVSGADVHGTPVVLTAEQEGVTPAELSGKYYQEFTKTFLDFGFTYDRFGTTEDPIHTKFVQEIFLKLLEKGYIYKQVQDLPYSVKAERFLPDRYVEGKCPICGFEDARGDQCDNCGNLLEPKQLINPISKLDKQTPEWRETEHFFLKLSVFGDQLKDWIGKAENWRTNAKNFSLGLLNKPLPDRAITRNIDWGVPIPVEGFEDKRIYVWFEAVCGYVSATQKWAEEMSDAGAWEKFWKNPEAYHYYIHGKDNIVFHSIIWPSMLMGEGSLHLPDSIISSEYLNLDGKQFSKSRKWAVWANQMLEKCQPDSIRYWLLMYGPETSDADFSWKSFQQAVNKDLVGVIANLEHRVFSFATKHFEGKMEAGEMDSDSVALLGELDNIYAKVGELIEAGNFRKSLERILALGDKANKYLEVQSPWTTIKSDPVKAKTALWVASQVIINLANLLYPFVPFFSQGVFDLIGYSQSASWEKITLDNIILTKPPQALVTTIPDELVAEAEAELK